SAALEAIESLSGFDAACPGAGWDEFLDTLDERLRSAGLDAGPERGGVRVLDAMDSRGESFKALFLIGLQEGVFPRQVREDFLLRDETRLALDKDAGYLIRAKKGPGYEEERLLFYLLVASASQRVYCVFQRSDETGRATTASDYLRKLCQACGTDLESAVSRRIARQPVAKLQELEAIEPKLLAPKELSLLAAIHQRDPRLLFKGLESHVPAFREPSLFEAGLQAIEALNSRGEPGAWDGLIRTPAVLIEAWDKVGLSPSGLENFRKCPFKFFCARVLGLAEDDEPSRSGELVPALRGKLYHRILEKFHRGLIADKVWAKASDKPLDKKVWMPKLKEAIKEELPSDRWREFGVYPVLWEGLAAGMERHLGVLAEADMADIHATGLRPAHLEAALEGTVKGVKFHGYADRVDSDGASYRVVDYKSKLKKDGLKTRVAGMAELQPPIYLELVKKTKPLDLAEAVAVSAAFYGIEQQEEGDWKEEYDAAMHAALGKRFFENIAAFKAMMDAGRFIITPDEGQSGPCIYCEFGGVCRKAHRLSRWRAENSKIFEALEKARVIPKEPDEKAA
ncbi:MAG: PD-(D/E)XK nuclease family protein, partial [Elusimicrobia bacterium]|nr:PD-(D/E)XK nuclease family protein [Elusimicrobiota bacterium]